MGLREDKSPLVGLIFLLALPLKIEKLTLENVTCKLLLLKRPTISYFFNLGLFAGYFFLIILPFLQEVNSCRKLLQFN